MKLNTFLYRCTNWANTKDLDKLTEYPYYETKYFLPNCTYGDYVGSSIEAANYRYLEQSQKYKVLFNCEVLKYWHGEYSSYGITITDKLPTMNREELQSLKDLFEDLAGLESYPCFKDEIVPEIEEEWKHEQFTGCMMSKDVAETIFKKLENELYELLGDDFDKHDLHDFDIDWEYLLNTQSEKTNTYWENESGNSMYINLDRALSKITIADLFNPEYWTKSLCPVVAGKLIDLHHQYTFKELGLF